MMCSWNAAYAGHRVMERSASSRVIFCSGYQPFGGQLCASCRDKAAWNEMSGFTSSTGKSLPFGMIDPLSRSDRQAYAPNSRVDPSRLPAQYMSLVWWLACIDGITPNDA